MANKKGLKIKPKKELKCTDIKRVFYVENGEEKVKDVYMNGKKVLKEEEGTL